MSMSINIDKVLKNTWGNYSPQKNNSTSKQANFDENIFAQASALVAEYKKEQEENKNSTSSSKKSSFGGLTFAQVAGMSTKDFLNYAYNNEAFSVDKQDSSGVDLPMFVRYKAQVVCTSGKSFMAVVAKFKAIYPHRSEEEIAAELMTKYGASSTDKTEEKNSQEKSQTGKTVNISA